jgi:hypothetical protein
MKLFGFILVAAGFLAGAYFLTGAGGSVLGAGFLVSLAIATAGVVLLRVVTRQRVSVKEKVTAEVRTAEESLGLLVDGVGELIEQKNTINVYDLPGEIDRRFVGPIERFVEARESIALAYGLPAYAAVMSHFAAGERYLNRVWSCSVDGYIDEAHTYLDRARDQFVEGRDRLKQLS